ncbi:MAG TPA: hypothetical protein VHM65_06605 [Candidatus Lustribacter sp.]|nr:hypothetical protein [Candidatus Lustribacter sp.]
MNEALWVLGRGTGTAALLLLTITAAIGVLTAGRFVSRDTPRFAVAELHKRAALAAAGLLVVHLASLLFDSEAQLRWVDLVLPFLNARNPLFWGLGTLAVDLIAVVTFTSLARKRIPHRWWRGIHWMSCALWPMAWLHSLGSGTDASTWWLRTVSVLTLSAVVAAVTYRLRGPAPAVRHHVTAA